MKKKFIIVNMKFIIFIFLNILTTSPFNNILLSLYLILALLRDLSLLNNIPTTILMRAITKEE